MYAGIQVSNMEKVGNVEDIWCISLVDDKTQQSSSPPPWICIVLLQIIPKISPICAKQPFAPLSSSFVAQLDTVLSTSSVERRVCGPIVDCLSFQHLWQRFSTPLLGRRFLSVLHTIVWSQSFISLLVNQLEIWSQTGWWEKLRYDILTFWQPRPSLFCWALMRAWARNMSSDWLMNDEKSGYLVFWLCDNLVSPCFVERWCELDRKLPQNKVKTNVGVAMDDFEYL